jgi:hypothetical protein
MKYLAGLFLVLVAVSGCVPAVQDTRPKIAFVNAPTESRVNGLAETLQTTLQTQETPFGFSRSSAVRFQETHRDMYGSRAPLQAAFIARSQGAVYAAMVGFENDGDVVNSSLSGNKVTITLKLNGRAVASIVDPVTANVLASFTSSVITAEGYETVTLDLPEGISVLDPRAQAILVQEVEDAKDRALERFLEKYAKEPLDEVAQPLADELTRLVATTASLAAR